MESLDTVGETVMHPALAGKSTGCKCAYLLAHVMLNLVASACPGISHTNRDKMSLCQCALQNNSVIIIFFKGMLALVWLVWLAISLGGSGVHGYNFVSSPWILGEPYYLCIANCSVVFLFFIYLFIWGEGGGGGR